MAINIQSNIQESLNARGPNERHASFDYCYNYFQSFFERNQTSQLADANHLEESCFHLGFFLASWGMYRGSADLPNKSARVLEPVVNLISQMDSDFWSIDVVDYDSKSIKRLIKFKTDLVNALNINQKSIDLLTSKIMLGVFANTPAFDENFRHALEIRNFDESALFTILSFYEKNKNIIDSYKIPTIDFLTGKNTNRYYSKAKIIDMVGFVEGSKK